jgi:tetratricopeptide (TPR) repeat protein
MEKFVKRHPNKIAYRKELAYLHEKAKNYPKAIENYKLVEAHEPKEKRYKTDLAIAYAYKKTGKAQEAKHYFKQAIDHAPNLNEKQLSYIRNEIVNNNRAFHFYLAQSFRLDNYKNGSNASSIINGATYAGFGDLQLSYQPSSFSKKVELFGELSHGHKKGEVVSSIQPSIGVRVHSLKKHNITLSAQQLIKRSDNTRNETLLRAAIGISSSPQTALNQNLYLESAYFIRNRATILYGNYEVGKNYKINHNLKIKPYLTAGGSYNNDNAHKNAITNLDVGVGVALKIKPHDSKYEPAPYSNKLKLEARKKYAGNTKDDKTIRLQWELFY